MHSNFKHTDNGNMNDWSCVKNATMTNSEIALKGVLDNEKNDRFNTWKMTDEMGNS